MALSPPKWRTKMSASPIASWQRQTFNGRRPSSNRRFHALHGQSLEHRRFQSHFALRIRRTGYSDFTAAGSVSSNGETARCLPRTTFVGMRRHQFPFGNHSPRVQRVDAGPPNTGEILHLELEAIDIPAAFPLDRAERSVDFEVVPIGQSSYLLPKTACWFGCFRNTYSCFSTGSISTTTDGSTRTQPSDSRNEGSAREL